MRRSPTTGTTASISTPTSGKAVTWQTSSETVPHPSLTRCGKGMPQTIRFLLDEHCPTALAEGLRRRGIDVTTTPEVDLMGASDEEQAAFGLSEGRVIFTQDK